MMRNQNLLSIVFFGGLCLGVGAFLQKEFGHPQVVVMTKCIEIMPAENSEDGATDTTSTPVMTPSPPIVDAPPPPKAAHDAMTFSLFRASFEVETKKPEDVAYALKQARELKGLLKTVPTVKEVTVKRLRGCISENGKEVFYEIEGYE